MLRLLLQTGDSEQGSTKNVSVITDGVDIPPGSAEDIPPVLKNHLALSPCPLITWAIHLTKNPRIFLWIVNVLILK